MAGLLFLGALIVFVTILIALSKWLTCRLKWSHAAVFFTRLAIVIGAFPLMLADEIIGLFNMSIYAKDIVFGALTYQRQKVIINRTEGGLVPHTALPIEEDFISLTDAQTKETLALFAHMEFPEEDGSPHIPGSA